MPHIIQFVDARFGDMSVRLPGSEAPESPHDTSRDDDPAYRRRRQLRFRSWHRGTKEADLRLGTFADAHLDDFTDAELEQFAVLLEHNDADLYDWATGRADPPAALDTPILRRLRAHRIADHLK